MSKIGGTFIEYEERNYYLNITPFEDNRYFVNLVNTKNNDILINRFYSHHSIYCGLFPLLKSKYSFSLSNLKKRFSSFIKKLEIKTEYDKFFKIYNKLRNNDKIDKNQISFIKKISDSNQIEEKKEIQLNRTEMFLLFLDDFCDDVKIKKEILRNFDDKTEKSKFMLYLLRFLYKKSMSKNDKEIQNRYTFIFTDEYFQEMVVNNSDYDKIKII